MERNGRDTICNVVSGWRIRFVTLLVVGADEYHVIIVSATPIDSIHARAIIGRKRGLAGIGTTLVGVKLLNTLQQVSKLTSTN